MWNNISWTGSTNTGDGINYLAQQAQQYASAAAMGATTRWPGQEASWGAAWPQQENEAAPPPVYGSYAAPPPQATPNAASYAYPPPILGQAPPPPPPPQEQSGNQQPPQTRGPTSSVASSPPPQFDESNDSELKEFDEQFKGWEKQFENWKKENSDHPDKDALIKYEADWSKWRAELCERRENMKSTKIKQMMEKYEKEREERHREQQQQENVSVSNASQMSNSRSYDNRDPTDFNQQAANVGEGGKRPYDHKDGAYSQHDNFNGHKMARFDQEYMSGPPPMGGQGRGLPPPMGGHGRGGPPPMGDQGRGGPPPLGGQGRGGPPPMGGQGRGDPPPMGGQGRGGPPPMGGHGRGGPPPLEGQGHGGPPLMSGQGRGGPPPMGGQGRGGPPPLEGQGRGGPPPMGGQGRGGPPPMGGQGRAGPPPSETKGYDGTPIMDIQRHAPSTNPYERNGSSVERQQYGRPSPDSRSQEHGNLPYSRYEDGSRERFSRDRFDEGRRDWHEEYDRGSNLPRSEIGRDRNVEYPYDESGHLTRNMDIQDRGSPYLRREGSLLSEGNTSRGLLGRPGGLLSRKGDDGRYSLRRGGTLQHQTGGHTARRDEPTKEDDEYDAFLKAQEEFDRYNLGDDELEDDPLSVSKRNVGSEVPKGRGFGIANSLDVGTRRNDNFYDDSVSGGYNERGRFSQISSSRSSELRDERFSTPTFGERFSDHSVNSRLHDKLPEDDRYQRPDDFNRPPPGFPIEDQTRISGRGGRGMVEIGRGGRGRGMDEIGGGGSGMDEIGRGGRGMDEMGRGGRGREIDEIGRGRGMVEIGRGGRGRGMDEFGRGRRGRFDTGRDSSPHLGMGVRGTNDDYNRTDFDERRFAEDEYGYDGARRGQETLRERGRVVDHFGERESDQPIPDGENFMGSDQGRVNHIGRGRGGLDSGRGRGGLDSGRGRAGLDSGRGRGGLDSGRGRGGPESGRGRGGPDSGRGRGGLDSGMGRGGMDIGRGSGGMHAGYGRGGMDAGRGRGGMDAGRGRGDMDAMRGRDGMEAGRGRGGMDARRGRGGMDAGRGRAGMEAGRGRGGMDARRGRGGMDAGRGRGGMGVGRGRGQPDDVDRETMETESTRFDGLDRSSGGPDIESYEPYGQSMGRGEVDKSSSTRGRRGNDFGRGGRGAPFQPTGRGESFPGRGRGYHPDSGRGRGARGRGASAIPPLMSDNFSWADMSQFRDANQHDRHNFEPAANKMDSLWWDRRSKQKPGREGIPGWDDPDSGKEGPITEKGALNNRMGDKDTTKEDDKPTGVFHEEHDDKIDIKMAEAGKLSLGPIGVGDKGPLWKPPADWYDDDEDEDDRKQGVSDSHKNMNPAGDSRGAREQPPPVPKRESEEPSSRSIGELLSDIRRSNEPPTRNRGEVAAFQDFMHSRYEYRMDKPRLEHEYGERFRQPFPEDLYEQQRRDDYTRPPALDRDGRPIYDRRDPYDRDPYARDPYGRDPYERERVSQYEWDSRERDRLERGDTYSRDRYERGRPPHGDRLPRDNIDREHYDRERDYRDRPPHDRYGRDADDHFDSRSRSGVHPYPDEGFSSKRESGPSGRETRDDRRSSLDRNRSVNSPANRYPGKQPSNRSEREGSDQKGNSYGNQPRGSSAAKESSKVEERPPTPEGTVVTIEDLVSVPGRFLRPPKLTIVLRGLPGSGKSTLAKMIKDKEVENGGSAPRILCLDDYFMVESEKMEVERDTGRKVKTKIMEYEYDDQLEERYRASLIKSYKKQLDDGFFPFIIMDCIHDKVSQFEEVLSYSAQNDFEVYIADVEGSDVKECHDRSTHKRPLQLMQKLADKWERTPKRLNRVDLTTMAQDAQIENVEMEDVSEDSNGDDNAENGHNSQGDNKESSAGAPQGHPDGESPHDEHSVSHGEQKASSELDNREDEEEDENVDAYKTFAHLISSKWDTEDNSNKLDKLDGVQGAKKRIEQQHLQINKPQNINEWLELSKDYGVRVSKPGKKRVRWADFVENKKQTTARERGFVFGQTDWQRMTDDNCGADALVQIRYIEPREGKK